MCRWLPRYVHLNADERHLDIGKDHNIGIHGSQEEGEKGITTRNGATFVPVI